LFLFIYFMTKLEDTAFAKCGLLKMAPEPNQLPTPALKCKCTGGAQGKSFEERLFELSKERKQREIELMELLSDVGDPETQMKQ